MPEQVTIVRMGHEARERCEEDDLCARILHARLRGAEIDVNPATELRQAPSAVKFFDPACSWAPEGDFERCTRLDVFDFVLQLVPDDPVSYLQCIPMA
jgi:hypothetical protein